MSPMVEGDHLLGAIGGGNRVRNHDHGICHRIHLELLLVGNAIGNRGSIAYLRNDHKAGYSLCECWVKIPRGKR